MKRNINSILTSTLLLSVLIMGGCASKNMEANYSDPADPWEDFNRSVFAFNEGVDAATLKPISKAYRNVVPSFVRYRVSNFFSNLRDIPNAMNDLLQGKLKQSANDVLRFTINTTFGVLGLFDAASVAGLEKHNEDIGQTLGIWGVSSGPYLVLPLLGPSTLRDVTNVVEDYALPHQLGYWDSQDAQKAVFAMKVIDQRTKYLDIEGVVRGFDLDFYTAVKSFYLARRKHLISDSRDDSDIEELYKEVE